MWQKLGALGPPKNVKSGQKIFFTRFIFLIWIDRTIRHDFETIFLFDLDLYFEGDMSFFMVKYLIEPTIKILLYLWNRLRYEDDIFCGSSLGPKDPTDQKIFFASALGPSLPEKFAKKWSASWSKDLSRWISQNLVEMNYGSGEHTFLDH